ncbi:MAG: carboxylate-amine ligase [Hyphomicrobiales bacterium]
MSRPAPTFTVGIEEEYLLVDRETRELVTDPPAELLPQCQAALGSQVSAEFLRSQIEVGTKVCASPAEAKAELARLRRTIADIAGEFGLAPIAASTHPSARWSAQRHSDKDRYHALARDLQVVARRMIICGMHVHVGIEDDELRIDLMNQLSYFLPHLLALSTSSPFWQGQLTGLKSYRLSVFDELPRTGLPEHFSGNDEYQRSIEVLVKAGLIEDSTKVWWDLRPSGRFPTLEMRITDVCPLLNDTIAIAALFVCICRMLYRLRRRNQRWRHYSPFLVKENRWRAKRYGMASGLVDFGRGEIVPFKDLLEELLELVREDIEFFDCRKEVEHARGIVRDGTSADRQSERYAAFLENGASEEEALRAVVDGLIEETVRDL